MIRVLVVDDHEVVRIGLRHILADYPAIQIAGEAADGETALRMRREIRPDVVLLDVCLPGLSGFEVTSRLKQANPNLGIIILTVHEQAPSPALQQPHSRHSNGTGPVRGARRKETDERYL
jgi:DNA-binding NarL/FixJ family response regulator